LETRSPLAEEPGAIRARSKGSVLNGIVISVTGGFSFPALCQSYSGIGRIQLVEKRINTRRFVEEYPSKPLDGPEQKKTARKRTILIQAF